MRCKLEFNGERVYFLAIDAAIMYDHHDHRLKAFGILRWNIGSVIKLHEHVSNVMVSINVV